MPRGYDYMNFILLNLGFMTLICILYYWIMIQNIKADWVNNRCNPVFMLFADNVEENFSYCIQNIQGNYMGYLLQPLTYITSVLTEVGGDFNKNLVGIRTMISNMRDSITSIIQNIFGVFLNIIIEFQKMTISIKDLVGKIIGTISVMMYILSGAQMTMESAWSGPPGQMVKALGSACFHSDTKIRLKNNMMISIEDIDVGDVLYDNTIIEAKIKIRNRLNEPLYCFKNKGEEGQDILVSGNHFVFHENKWIRVKNVPDIKEEDTHNILYNLITSNGTIKIGEVLFHDFEDDELSEKEKEK